jgi:hypothetical protein
MSEQASARGYETSDAPPWLIASLAIGAAAFILVTPLILQALNPVHERSARLERHPPAPQLQIDARSDLASFRQTEQSQLDALGWVDRDQNVVRIPIGDAMRIVAQRGLPGWPGGSASSSTSAER